MASYNELNALIDAYINRNGVQAITGQILNGVLKVMVEQLGRGYAIMGVADLTTDPGTPDAPESWFASTPGTYTNFGGLVVADAEFAIFSYTPQTETWEKTTLTEGIKQIVCATHENGGHIPNVEASYEDGVLTLDFYNLQGLPGENATIDQVTADLVEDGGQPDASVITYGIGTTKSFAFTFKNLKGDKGETGVTSVVATVDNTTGTPACTVSLVGQQLTLAFTGLKGAQGDTGSSVDYPFTIVNNLTTDDATQALSAAQGVVLDGKVTQLEAEVTDLNNVTGTQAQQLTLADFTEITGGYYIGYSNPGELMQSNAWKTFKLVITGKLFPGGTAVLSSSTNGVYAVGFYSDENTISHSTFISGIQAVIVNNQSYTIDNIPSNCKAVCICNKTELGTPAFSGSFIYSNRLDDIEDKFDDIDADNADLSKRLDATDLEWEQGSITGGGAESADAKRVRTKGYVYGPFSIKLKSGYSIQRIAKYATDGTYLSSPYDGGNSGLPYYTINESGNYRVVVCVTGAGSNILPTDDFLDKVVSTYAFKVDAVDGKVADLKGETITERGTTRRVVENISQVTDITKRAGDNAAPQNAYTVTLSALASYDSYYFYLTRDADVWLQDDGQVYLSICYVKDAYPIFGNDITGSEAARKRKSENNLPTEASPISLHKGDAIIVTVPSGGDAKLGRKEYLDIFNGETPLAQAHINQVLEQADKTMYLSKTATEMDIFLRLSNGQFLKYPFNKRYKAYTANEYPSFYDNWGIGQVALADLSGGAMVDNANLFAIGEAELAISVASGLDANENKYVGGNAHGFENIVTGDNGREVSILVNNQKVAEDAVISLTPVEKVEVIQHTKLCQAYTNSDPWADATKHWVWEKGKMSCTSSVKILRALTIAFSQFGMFCVYRHWLGNDNNDYLTNAAIKNNLPYKVWNVEDGWSASGLSLPDKDCTRIVEYGERGFGFSMSIKSETTKASGGMFIAPPAAAYNKIYFDMGRSFTPSVNDVLEATQTWEIYK